jgi:hypothetical protein
MREYVALSQSRLKMFTDEDWELLLEIGRAVIEARGGREFADFVFLAVGSMEDYSPVRMERLLAALLLSADADYLDAAQSLPQRDSPRYEAVRAVLEECGASGDLAAASGLDNQRMLDLVYGLQALGRLLKGFETYIDALHLATFPQYASIRDEMEHSFVRCLVLVGDWVPLYPEETRHTFFSMALNEDIIDDELDEARTNLLERIHRHLPNIPLLETKLFEAHVDLFERIRRSRGPSGGK